MLRSKPLALARTNVEEPLSTATALLLLLLLYLYTITIHYTYYLSLPIYSLSMTVTLDYVALTHMSVIYLYYIRLSLSTLHSVI